MKDRQDSNDDNLLQQATRALRQRAVPDGPPSDKLAELVAMLENAANQPRALTITKRIVAMKPIIKIALAATVLLAFYGLFAWMTPSRGGAGIAFGQVGKQVQQARTMTWKRTIAKAGGHSMVTEYAYKEPGLLRQEVRGQLAPGEPGELTFIYDFNQAKMLMFDSRTMSGSIRNLGNLPEKVRRLFMDYGWRLKALFDHEGTPLGDKEIRGRPATGFQVMHDLVISDIWVDAKTGHPLLIETWNPYGTSEVISDFVFDQNLDDSLFSLTPPEDYTVSKTIEDARAPSLNEMNESDLIEGLRFLAEHNHNAFPPQLGITPEIVRNLKEAEEKRTISRTEAGRVFDGFARFIMFTECDQWHYAGKSVKLGTPGRPILWYKPTGNDNYRVIYADLSVKEVAAEELKGFPETSDPG